MCRGTSTAPLLLGPWERVQAATLDVLARAAGRPGHIFNLGHGVMPDTDPDVLGRLRAFVHEQTARVAGMSTAVVLMAYGSPDRLADVPAYYADIRGGRPISPERLDDLVARYRRLGIEESNPLNEITEATRAALEARLGLPVFTGMRHWTPRIAEAVEQALSAGATEIVGLVLAPHYSSLSIEKYREQVVQALDGRAELRFVERWGQEPGFVSLLAERLTAHKHEHVVFTAHSLPARILDEGDPYRDELLETARLVAESAGAHEWTFSFQSQSPTGEPWLGPDILEHLNELAACDVRDVVLCPIGFVADHLEIRWDLDIEAAERARELGLRLERIELPNADPAFIDVLAGLVRRHVGCTVSGVKTGQIRVEAVSRRFRVRANEARSLKELFVLGGRTEATDVVALQDVSLAVEPGEAVGLVGRNGSGKSTLLRLIAGIIKPTEGSVAVGGRIGSLLELGAGFHPDFSGRENVFLNGAIYGLKRAQIRERFDEIVAFAELEQAIDRPVRTYSSGMYMRLGFAIAAHLDADVLLLDEVFAVGDEAFQRKCFGKVFEFKQRGGTIVFVSHDATQVERLCERAVLLREGKLEFDGPTHEAIVRYRKGLAADADPAERAAGLREWGTGEATIAAARLVGAEGEERQQFLAGEPFSLRLRIEAENGIAPPQLQLELRDEAGLLVASDVLDTGSVGWASGTQGACATTSIGCRSRTAASISGWASRTRAESGSCTGSTTRSSSSSIPRERNAESFGWKGAGLRRRTRKPDELAHLSRLARPDGARAGSSVHALHRRRGAAAGGGAEGHLARLPRRRRDLLRSRPPRLLRRAHRPRGRRGAARHALVRGARVRRARARALQPPRTFCSGSVFTTAPRAAPPRRAVATDSSMFPSPRTE